MPNIQSFPGWRYHPEHVAMETVLSVPWHMSSADERVAAYGRSVGNAAKVAGGIELAGDAGDYNWRRRACEHLSSWRKDGTLYNDNNCIYIFEQKFDLGGESFIRRGFFARVMLDEIGNDILGCAPDEKIVEERLELIRSCRGNTGCTLALIEDGDEDLRRSLDGTADWQPTFSTTYPANTENRFWVVDGDGATNSICSSASRKKMFIAAGTEDYCAALRYRDEARKRMTDNRQHPGDHGSLPCDWYLVFCIPTTSPGLRFEDSTFKKEMLPKLFDKTLNIDKSLQLSPFVPDGLAFNMFW